MIQSADDHDETDGDFAHGEHVLDFEETFHTGVVDKRHGACLTRAIESYNEELYGGAEGFK